MTAAIVALSVLVASYSGVIGVVANTLGAIDSSINIAGHVRNFLPKHPVAHRTVHRKVARKHE